MSAVKNDSADAEWAGTAASAASVPSKTVPKRAKTEQETETPLAVFDY